MSQPDHQIKPARQTPASTNGIGQGIFPACNLERMLDKSAAEWRFEDICRLVQDQEIRFLALMHVGGDGHIKTLDFTPRNPEHLRDILEGGERADGSSLFGTLGIKPGASDVVLRPRIETAFLDPFALRPTLAIMCSHVGQNGEPLPESPDTVVRHAYQRLLVETGIELWALGEIEYFLGKQCAEVEAYGAEEKGYHATAPFVFGEGMRRSALAILAEMGMPVKYGHSEVGYVEATAAEPVIWEQHEIELSLAPLAQAAEAVALTQWVLLNLAQRNGMRCSFNPVVRQGHAGSGLHFHFSPTVHGKHLGGRDDQGSLTGPAKLLIAGLVQLAAPLMAFGNRDLNSFVRLAQGKEAPTAVSWGEYNRHALIRLPIVPRAKDGRITAPPTIEFRLPDGSAFPHLLLAGVAQAIVYARETEKIDALLERTNAAQSREPADCRLPRSFGEVADVMLKHRAEFEAGGVFPPRLIDSVIDVLRKHAGNV